MFWHNKNPEPVKNPEQLSVEAVQLHNSIGDEIADIISVAAPIAIEAIKGTTTINSYTQGSMRSEYYKTDNLTTLRRNAITSFVHISSDVVGRQLDVACSKVVETRDMSDYVSQVRDYVQLGNELYSPIELSGINRASNLHFTERFNSPVGLIIAGFQTFNKHLGLTLMPALNPDFDQYKRKELIKSLPRTLGHASGGSLFPSTVKKIYIAEDSRIKEICSPEERMKNDLPKIRKKRACLANHVLDKDAKSGERTALQQLAGFTVCEALRSQIYRYDDQDFIESLLPPKISE